MRESEDLPYIVIERHSAGVTPFLWGALLGAGAALLLAPRSGRETQEEIRQNARRIRLAAEEQVQEVRDTMTGAVTRTRGRVEDQLGGVRGIVEAQAERARQAFAAGREAAKEARAELEQRVAQARQASAAAADAAAGRPTGDVVVTDVIVEEAEQRPDLG